MISRADRATLEELMSKIDVPYGRVYHLSDGSEVFRHVDGIVFVRGPLAGGTWSRSMKPDEHLAAMAEIEARQDAHPGDTWEKHNGASHVRNCYSTDSQRIELTDDEKSLSVEIMLPSGYTFAYAYPPLEAIADLMREAGWTVTPPKETAE